MSFSLLGVFAAGLLTFLSPCVLPLAPVFTASLLGSSSSNRWAKLVSTLWFALGFSVTFVLMGLGISSLASSISMAKPIMLGLGGVVLVLFGLKMMGVVRTEKYFQWMNRSFQLPSFMKRLPGGLHGLVFGVLFGLSWTPCVGPVLGGVLTYVASRDRTPGEGALLLGTFSLGISLPLLALAAGSEYVGPALNRFKRHLPRIEYAIGLGLFVFGFYIFNQARLQTPPLMSSSGQPMAIQAVTDTGAIANLSHGSSSQMVFFYSENCPVCHAMQKHLPGFEQACASDSFHFHRVNIDRPENYAVASHFGIKAVPTTTVVDREGHPMVNLVGYQTEGRLREAATAVTQVACADGASEKHQELLLPEQLETGQTCEVGKAC